MTTKHRISAIVTALVVAGSLAACAEAEVTPTVTPEPTITVTTEPTQTPEPEPTPEPTQAPEPELVPVPEEVIAEAKAKGGKARKTVKQSRERGDELVALARKTFEETGRKVVFVNNEGRYGWEGELVETFYVFMTVFPELQQCRDARADTVEGAVKLAQKCIAKQENPEVYEIVVTV